MSEIARRYYTDPGTGLEVIHSRQDYDDLLAMNAALRNAPRPSSRLHHSGNEKFYRVAQIPNLLIEEFLQKGINFYTEEGAEFITRRVLNSSEYEGLRTAPGRI